MRTVPRHEIDAIRRFAANDRSDPFTFNRCMSHARNGITRDGKTYEAEEYQYEGTCIGYGGRLLHYPITDYKNVKRP